ncbi:MAG: flagellar motor protein MotB [Bryobacteraceae bacterium]
MARRAKYIESHENHERWLISYADFITLMFAFFVVMFAASQQDKNQIKQVAEAVTKALDEGPISQKMLHMIRLAEFKATEQRATWRASHSDAPARR